MEGPSILDLTSESDDSAPGTDVLLVKVLNQIEALGYSLEFNLQCRASLFPAPPSLWPSS